MHIKKDSLQPYWYLKVYPNIKWFADFYDVSTGKERCRQQLWGLQFFAGEVTLNTSVSFWNIVALTISSLQKDTTVFIVHGKVWSG